MRTIYQVRRENISLYTGNTQEVVHETTRKREAERWLNGLAKCYNKANAVVWIREGYFQLPEFDCEYFICKAPQTTI